MLVELIYEMTFLFPLADSKFQLQRLYVNFCAPTWLGSASSAITASILASRVWFRSHFTECFVARLATYEFGLEQFFFPLISATSAQLPLVTSLLEFSIGTSYNSAAQ